MKVQSVVVLLLVGLVAAMAYDISTVAAWKTFKLKYGKAYPNRKEEQLRLQIFDSNLKAANARNLKDSRATFGVTKFSDLTPQEFREIYLMNVSRTTGASPTLKQAGVALPDSYDWSSKGMVTPVKNQGQCGSCWDFSATETIESVCAIAGYSLNQLSEQQILDCDTTDGGCNGGWPYNAYDYVISAGGIESEQDYPYTAEGGSCNFQAGDVICVLESWQYVTQNQDEDAVQNFVYSNSPVSVCVDAEIWQTYTGGVITTDSNCGNNIDHCVQITGWQQMSGMTVWNVRNSWGADWGVSGYIYVEKGGDVCAIAEVVTVPCVKDKTGKTVC